MPEQAVKEFWRDLKPIPDVFRPNAKPEVYAHKIAQGDPRYWIPFTETVSKCPAYHVSSSKPGTDCRRPFRGG